MKTKGIVLGLILVLTGLAHAAQDEDSQSGGSADQAGDGNGYTLACTEAGVNSGLEGDELDAYVQNCIEEMNSENQLSVGEQG